MAHAGITPQWDLETAQQCARDVEAVLSSDSYPFFLDAMYGDMPNHWSNELSGLARLRFISNAFTRMRYCFPNGQLDMYSKEAPEDAPAPLKPWFAIPGPVSNAYSIAFGHWASLEGRGTPEGFTPRIPAAAGAGNSPACAGKISSTSPSRQTGRKASTKAKPSRPDSSRIAARCALSGLPAASFCRVAANALPDLHFLAICSPGSAREDEARDGKHDEILSAPSSRNSCKKPRSRQTRPGFLSLSCPLNGVRGSQSSSYGSSARRRHETR